MRRHERDTVSLVTGLLFGGTGVAWLTGVGAGVDVDGRWVLPTLLVGLGVAGLLGSRPDREVVEDEPV